MSHLHGDREINGCQNGTQKNLWHVIVEENLTNKLAMKTHTIEICSALSEFTQVTLYSHTPDEYWKGNLVFSHSQLPSKSFKPNNLSTIIQTFQVFRFLKNLKRSPATIYIRATAFGLGPLLWARRMNIPAILEINGAWDEEQALSRRKFTIYKRFWIAPIQWLRSVSLTVACHLATHLVVVTPQLVGYLKGKKISPEKIWVVPNGVNPTHITPLDQDTSRISLDLPLDKKLIGYIGSLAAWQGVELLIEAFSLLPDQYKANSKILIVGDGELGVALKAQAIALGVENMTHFVGPKPSETIPFWLAACDILVAPKQVLSSGYSTLKVYEYMASARPVVGSNVNGLEMISTSGCGLTFIAGNVLDLRLKLLELLNLSAEELKIMGNNGRKWVINSATWSKSAETIYNIVKT